MDGGLIDSLRAAVEASPDDVRLRLHLAELLLEAGEPDEARIQLGRVLQLDPTSARAIELVAASQAGTPGEVDWEGLERELGDVAPPMFVEGVDADDDAWEIQRRPVTLVLLKPSSRSGVRGQESGVSNSISS